MNVKGRESLIGAAEAAEMLGVTAWRILALARQKIVPHVRLGRTVRFSRDQLAAFVERGGKSFAGGWRKEPGDAGPIS
jgi:excisionase family DNA binding protein